jgi:hypothetical protein
MAKRAYCRGVRRSCHALRHRAGRVVGHGRPVIRRRRPFPADTPVLPRELAQPAHESAPMDSVGGFRQHLAIETHRIAFAEQQ